ncbi:MAG: cysteine desulfurase, partial [Alphaproteobacteria bacterium]
MDETQTAYLDYNATAPLVEAARQAMDEAMDLAGNPSSVHGAGRLARQRIEAARAQIAACVGAAPGEVVFTSGGSEANALALSQVPVARRLVSAIEHPSVLAYGAPFAAIPVSGDGGVDLDALQARLRQGGVGLVSVMAANNETGVVQPVDEVVRLAHAHGARVHVDAVQALGKMPLDFAALGADYLSLSAHKIGGPQGVGALLVRAGLDVAPLLRGGGQEMGRRAGTENLCGIAGFAAAVGTLMGRADWVRRVAALRDALESRVLALAPETVIFGRHVPRLVNTSCLALAGLSAETQLMALDLAGVHVSAGSACSSGKIAQSHVLAAMRVEPALARAAIRVSLGPYSRAADVDAFVDAWG